MEVMISIIGFLVWILIEIIVVGSLVIVIYSEISFKLFGKKTVGYVIGYTNKSKGRYGAESYNYRIEYNKKDETIHATSLQGILVPFNTIPQKNLHNYLNIRYMEKKPELVYIDGSNIPLFLEIIALIFFIVFFYTLGKSSLKTMNLT